MTRALRLYHWTCAHRAPGIRQDGAVKPYMGLSWWTDLEQPGGRTRKAVVLTSRLLDCDRMAYRCEAGEVADIIRWRDYVKTAGRDAAWVEELEMAPGAKPEHWWVSQVDVPVRSVRRLA